MAHLMLGVLGTLHITLPDDSNAAFESDKCRALLVYLAVEADRPHRRDALIGLLWPDESEESARHNLRQALFSLRHAIGDPSAHPPYLLITREEIQFNAASDYTLDVASFRSHLAACAGHSHTRLDRCAICAPRLQQAVDLYRGKFLQQFFLEDSTEFEEWALARREALHQAALDALSDLAGYDEYIGDLGSARRCALRQLELDPWREQAHRQIMRVLALEGQRGAAIAQYEACRRALADELGVEPSAETQELYEQIRTGRWQADGGNGHALVHAASSSRPPTSNLPAQLTPFVGREREMADLGRLIADPACRCISLVGPGGMGKTRLALQAASQHRAEFAHGVAFVPLVAINSVEDVVPAIARAIGYTFRRPTEPRVQLIEYLRDKQMLLILDNLEQLLDVDSLQGNAAGLVVDLLQEAPDVKLLLTAREPLSVQGEWVFEVEGLQIPEHDRLDKIESSAAAALFLQRAQRAHIGFALREQDQPALAHLCRLVGGMPLALELAATWVRTLSVPEIVAEIERNLDFLSAAVRDLPERHRSMRVVFDHSWDMLTPDEQRVLLNLSVFHGPFQRQAAEQVAGASLATLSALVAKSLLRRTDSGHYDLHELVRQYGASRLAADGSAPSIGERHSRYYLDWLGQCADRLRDRRQKETVAGLSAEVDNLRAAWDWALTNHDFARMHQASPALWYFLELRSWLTEGETIFRAAAQAVEADVTPTTLGDTAIALHAMRAHASFFSLRLGKVAQAYTTLLPSVAFLQSTTDDIASISAATYLGMTCWQLRKLAEARERLQDSMEKAQACAARWYEAAAGEYLGFVAHDMGDEEQAQRYLSEALAGARSLGDPMLTIQALSFLAQTAMAAGQTGEAESLWHECLGLAQDIGYRSGIGRALDGLGEVLRVTSPQEAIPLFTASSDVFREVGDLRNRLLALTHQAYSSLTLDDDTSAHDSFVTVLRLARTAGLEAFVLDALLGLATVRAKHRADERCLELVIHVLQHAAVMPTTRSRAQRLRTELEARLAPEQVETAGAQAVQQSFDQAISQVLDLVATPSWYL